MRVALPLVILLGACGGKSGDSEPGSASAATRSVSFGDCGGVTTTFVSGPRPLPPLEVHDDDDLTTGYRTISLDEGKLGKPDSARTEGQYKMKKNSDNPQLVRQQAMEAARNAGLLGALDDDPLRRRGALEETPLYGGTGDPYGDRTSYGFAFGRSPFEPDSYADLYGHKAVVPTVVVGTPGTTGDLDKAIIRRYIKRNVGKIQDCYETELLVKPDITGAVTVQFFISGSGRVITANGSGMDPAVASCVATVIKGIEFPKPKGGGGVQVTYPFEFRIAGSGSATPQATPPPPKPVAKRALHRSPWAEWIGDRWTPGEDNPLRDHSDPITACIAKATKPYGVAVVELAAKSPPKVYGVDDATTACIVAAATKIAYVEDEPMRCPLAYGDMPIADLATVDLTARSVSYNGMELVEMPLEHPTVLPLVTALHLAIDPIIDVDSGPVIAIHGPVNVKIADDARYGDVVTTLATILTTGDDFILSTKRGTEWKQLIPTTFPIIPVAFATGAPWAPIKARGGRYAAATKLSMFITSDAVWITGQRQEPIEVKRDAQFAATLKSKMEGVRHSPLFDDRVDVEVGGDDTVTWRDIMILIDAAVAGGFRGWELTDRDGLTTLAPALSAAQ